MITKSPFKPPWWLFGSHLQTMWPTFVHRRVDLDAKRERIELSDGDFLDIDWVLTENKGPIVILLHGLGGGLESSYSKGLLSALLDVGMRPVFMYFRGCSGEVNRLPRSYHSGDTGDITSVVEHIKTREPNTPTAAIGISLGGNVLLKWLGETGSDNPLDTVIAVSVPFDLPKAARRIDSGFSKFYQWYLLRQLKKEIIQKFKRMKAPIDVSTINKVNNFWEFDEYVTAPLHGFEGAHHYYFHSSSRQYLKDITTPVLVIHAEDDPFMTRDTIPKEEELSDYVTLELSKHGGHVGFITGTWPWKPVHWLEQRIPEYLYDFFHLH